LEIRKSIWPVKNAAPAIPKGFFLGIQPSEVTLEKGGQLNKN